MTRRRQRAPSTTPEPEITAAALEALGMERLAAILLTHAEWDDALSQTLRLAIAASSTSTDASNAAGNGDGLARALSAEIARIAKDDRFYGYRDGRILAAELDRVRQSIMEDLLPVQPRAAAELLARFILLDAQCLRTLRRFRRHHRRRHPRGGRGLWGGLGDGARPCIVGIGWPPSCSVGNWPDRSSMVDSGSYPLRLSRIAYFP